MAVYKILFKKSVDKDFKKIPSNDLQKILKRIKNLAVEPRPSGVEKLSDQSRYRIRHGNYRIVYSIEDSELTIWVVKVAHRKHVYQLLH